MKCSVIWSYPSSDISAHSPGTLSSSQSEPHSLQKQLIFVIVILVSLYILSYLEWPKPIFKASIIFLSSTGVDKLFGKGQRVIILGFEVHAV